MNKYSTIKTKRGWIGFGQTSIRWNNYFSIWWQFLNNTEFAISILNIGKVSLFYLNFHKWKKHKGIYLSFSILFLPTISFRIGNSRTWLYIRNENLYGWICNRKNRTLPF